MVLVAALEGLRIWQSLQAERTRATELERQLAVSRLDALRMQLHPHFLFNTLHAIAGLIVEQPPTARRMVIALGDLLRLTLKDTGSSIRSLAEELEFADLYLGIEKLRLGDRLVLDYDIEPEATSAQVPELLLQPLFENAVRHGAARMLRSCGFVSAPVARVIGCTSLSTTTDPSALSHRGRRRLAWDSRTRRTGSVCTIKTNSGSNTRTVRRAGCKLTSPFRTRKPKMRD